MHESNAWWSGLCFKDTGAVAGLHSLYIRASCAMGSDKSWTLILDCMDWTGLWTGLDSGLVQFLCFLNDKIMK